MKTADNKKFDCQNDNLVGDKMIDSLTMGIARSK